jgi:D-arabinose 1-dehydrogenase-like Zn-dependent alcohol dehydrogenase
MIIIPFAPVYLKPKKLVSVGLPGETAHVAAFTLIFGNRSLPGSLIGGIAKTKYDP